MSKNTECKGRNRHNVEWFLNGVVLDRQKKTFFVVSVSASIFFILFVTPIRSL